MLADSRSSVHRRGAQGQGPHRKVLEGYFYTNEKMRRMVADFQADAVGVYVISLLWKQASRFITDVRADNPGIFTFIGGHGATAMPERLLAECPALDAVVVGEGKLPPAR